MEDDSLTLQFLKELQQFEEDVGDAEQHQDYDQALKNFEELNELEDNFKMDEETLEFFKKTLGDGSQDYISK